MHSKSHNIWIMISIKAVEGIKELFDLLKRRYQNNLDSMKGSEFVLDYVQLLYYKCHKYYVSKYNSNREKIFKQLKKLKNLLFQWIQIEKIAKLSPNDHGIIFAIKQLSALLRGITSKSYDGFYCLNLVLSFRRNYTKRYVKIKIFVAL